MLPGNTPTKNAAHHRASGLLPGGHQRGPESQFDDARHHHHRVGRGREPRRDLGAERLALLGEMGGARQQQGYAQPHLPSGSQSTSIP
jgi:hypothetical protein